MEESKPSNVSISPSLRGGAGERLKLSVLEMNRLSVEEFHEAEKMPLIVVLDDVRSLYNIGSVFRTADAFRVESIYLCGISATPAPAEGAPECTLKAQQEIHKTALGAEESVDWKYFPTALEAVRQLKNDGYEVLAVEQCHGSTMLNDFRPESGKRYAVILGNEVKGVHQEVIDQCDGCLEIPQYGTKHSLNVSVTGGIVIWSFVAQPSQPLSPTLTAPLPSPPREGEGVDTFEGEIKS